MKQVPNIGPKDAKVVLVGEAPGFEEEQQGEPFVGRAGEKLAQVLMRNGLSREEVYLANLCQHRPPNNKLSAILSSKEMQQGLTELTEQLQEIKPNVIVALGGWPLWFLTGKSSMERGKPKPGVGINLWRGSVLNCILTGLSEVKVIPTFHPSYVARDAKQYPTFDLDIKRIVEDSTFPELRLPKRQLVINPTPDELEHYVREISKAPYVSVDIETFGDTLACVGFSTSPEFGLCIPWKHDSSSEAEAIRRLLLADNEKIFHFGIFDNAFLRSRGIKIRGWAHDTFVLQRTMWAQLPRSLAYITSVYTREPYYKHEGKGDDQKSWKVKSTNLNQLWLYNCKDVCCTYECFEKMYKELRENKKWLSTYEFDMEVVTTTMADISHCGIPVDSKRQEALRKAVAKEWEKHQINLNNMVGVSLSDTPKYVPYSVTPQFINAGSPKQCMELFYDILGFKARTKRSGEETADEAAIIGLIAEAKKEYDVKKTNDAKDRWLRKLLILKTIWIIRGLRKKLSSYIDIKISPDGRMRGLYKPATETGRWAAEKWIDGTGCNPQTIPRDKVEIPEG
jgi:uracil-DNA glycosylase